MAIMYSDPDSDAPSFPDVRHLRPVYAGEIERLKRAGRRRRMVRRLGALAAAGLGCLLLGWISFGWRDVEAENHAPRSIPLADGSRIDLDAGGLIRLPLAPWRHEVSLMRGDAVFDIVHDDSRPFVVRAGTTTLTDLGTRFLVQTSSMGVSVAVFEGRVLVSSPAGRQATLDVGQAVSASETAITRIAMPSEGEATAWRQGRLIFRDMQLAKVAAVLSRYRDQPVEIGTPAIASLKVSGLFHIDDIDGGLRLLEQALPVDVSRKGDRTILEARNRDSGLR